MISILILSLLETINRQNSSGLVQCEHPRRGLSMLWPFRMADLNMKCDFKAHVKDYLNHMTCAWLYWGIGRGSCAIICFKMIYVCLKCLHERMQCKLDCAAMHF